MSQSCSEQEFLVAQAVTLFRSDTVLAALRVTQRYGLRQVPVVDEESGEWLGDISEEELYRLWATAPLAQMGEILLRREAVALIEADSVPANSDRDAYFDCDPECEATYH